MSARFFGALASFRPHEGWRSRALGDRTALELLLLAFVLSRFCAHAAGVKFNATTLTWYYQYLDVALLERDLARSLYYLHAQPPAFNALLGAVLKLPERYQADTFELVFAAFGVVLAVSSYSLLRSFALRPPTALFFAGLYAVGPEAILYENWLFYAYPVAALVVASLAAYARFLSRPTFARGLVAFGIMALLVYARAVYHAAWLVFAIALPFFRLRRHRRVLLASAALPLALVVALYLKNAIVFGMATTSSWFGMNVSRVITDRVPVPERAALVQAGKISDLAMVPALLPIDAVPPKFLGARAPKPYPVLAAARKSTGDPNANAFEYIALSKQYQRDALALIRLRPRLYFTSVKHDLRLFSIPVDETWLLNGNRGVPLENYAAIRRWTEIWDKWVLGVRDRWSSAPKPVDVGGGFPANIESDAYLGMRRTRGFLWVVGAAALAATVSAILHARRRRLWARDLAALFAWTTIGYVTLVGTLFERGENNRFRMEIQPLMFLFAAIFASQLGAVVARARAPRLRNVASVQSEMA